MPPETLETVYHVFTHGTDAWYSADEWREARRTYGQFAREQGSARLYEEVYTDRSNDEMRSEECLFSFGPYPL